MKIYKSIQRISCPVSSLLSFLLLAQTTTPLIANAYWDTKDVWVEGHEETETVEGHYYEGTTNWIDEYEYTYWVPGNYVTVTNGWVDDDSGCTDEPIDTSNGNNYFTEQRLSVPCPGVSLALDLKYQSVTNRPAGSMGRGWIHSYEWALNFGSDSISLYTGSGSRLTFSENSDGTYDAPDSTSWTLETSDGGYDLQLPGGTTYAFDTNGCLQYIRDGWNNRATCGYDTNGSLETVTHSNGRQLTFSNEWNAAAETWQPVSIAVDGGASLAFAYNADGQFTQLVEQVDAVCSTSIYRYADGCLTNKVNGAGFNYVFGYENESGSLNGKGISLTVDGYYEHEVDYVSDSATDVTYHMRGQEQRFRYSRDDEGRLTTKYGPGETLSEALELGESYSYAANGVDKEEITYFDEVIGETFTEWAAYDDRHNVTNYSAAYNSDNPVQVLASTYDSEWQLPSARVEPDGSRTETIYTNGSPAVVKAFYSDTESYDTAFSYTTNGLLRTLTNANDHVVNFRYDSMGNRTAVVPPAGPSVTNTYNALGFVQSLEMLSEDGFSTGRKTEFETDAHGRVKTITFADGLENTYAYNALGYLTNIVDRAGRTTDYTYAPTRKLTSATRYLNQAGSNIPVRIGFDLDKQVNVLRVSEPRGRYVESYKLDIQDRVTAVTNIEGQVMNIDYGLGGFVKQIERFDGSSVSNSYDSAGRLACTGISNSESGTPNVEVNYSYWPDSRLKSVDDASSFVEYDYDLLNRLTCSTSSVSSVISVVNQKYDPAGNVTNAVVSSTDFTDELDYSYAYDEAERLTEITAGLSTFDRQTFDYIYNPDNGRVASISNSVSGLVCSYQYDLLDRVTNITYQAGTNLVRSIDYEYDAVSMITKKRISNNDRGTPNIEVSYTYDSLNRLVHESTSTNGHSMFDIGYSYDLAGNRLSKTSDGLKITYSLGTGNRLASSITTATNTYFVSGTSSETIGTDNLWGTLYISNLTANTGVVPDVNGSSFSAEVPVLGDCSNTLIAAIRDEAGNMGYATNHLWVGDFTTENTEAQSFGYDSAGCLTNLNGLSLAWDERYRLTSVSSASSVVQYSYDVLGRRVSRIESEISNPSSAITNLFVYNGNQVVADLDGSGNVLRSYVWGTGIDNLLCFTDHTTSNTYYAVKDHQNTVLALVDETGAVVESYEYSAYGEVLDVKDSSGNSIENQQSEIGNRYTFHGREMDWTTGLIHFRARWYEPESGRWISKDPIGISGGLNLYEFCGSNPVNFVDPDGLLFKSALSIGLYIAGGIAGGFGLAISSPVLIVGGGLLLIGGIIADVSAGLDAIDAAEDSIKDSRDELYDDLDDIYDFMDEDC